MPNKETKTFWFSANEPITTSQTLTDRNFEVITTQVTSKELVEDWVNVLITTNKGE